MKILSLAGLIVGAPIAMITAQTALHAALTPHVTPPAAANAVRPAVLQAPASTEKSQFFPEGLSVPMQPEDLWHIATDMPPNELPPPQFDHATKKPVTVVDVASEAELRERCGWTTRDVHSILVGCSAPSEVICKIFLGPPQTERTGVTRNVVLRHEIGHCEGWPADHPNPKAPLQLAADEGVAPVDGADAPPPPPRRYPRPRYHEPPVYGPPPYAPPPGWIFIPSEQRAMPCLPTLLSFGLVRFCI
jgi:hypothetical protein